MSVRGATVIAYGIGDRAQRTGPSSSAPLARGLAAGSEGGGRGQRSEVHMFNALCHK